MDTDYLEQRCAEELARAETAACIASRAAHRNLAALYHAAIEGRLPLPPRPADRALAH